VGDRDRVDARPAAVELAETGEDTGAAVEQQAAVALDEIPRLDAAGIRPGGRAADHSERHAPILPISPARDSVYNSAVARASSDMLKNVPLFAGLDSRELEQIAATMRERKFAAGDTVTEEGAGGAGFFVVETGEAEVSVEGEARGSIKAGDYFGEIALLTGSDRTATITAKTDMVCWGMTPWDFRPLVESNSTIAWKLLTAMADKLK
jgi:hypothetical protein